MRGLCPSCFAEVYGLIEVPKEFAITFCKRCGSVKAGDSWSPVSGADDICEAAKEAISKSVKVREGFVVSEIAIRCDVVHEGTLSLIVRGLIGGESPIVREFRVALKPHYALCPRCMKAHSKSFDAVVQLRYVNPDPSIEHFIAEVREAFAQYISELNPCNGGYDIKLVDTNVARAIANMAKGRWKLVKVMESHGDVKRAPDGSRRSRLHVSVRILNVKPGDYVIVGGAAYTVVHVAEDSVQVADSSGTVRRVSLSTLVRDLSRYKAKRRT